jgi:hypothetical protein
MTRSRSGAMFFLLWLLCFCCNSDGFCYSEVVHEEMNGYVARNEVQGFSLHRYLSENIGLEDGVNEILSNEIVSIDEIVRQRLWQWVREGGRREDDPLMRSFRHFHDPLKPWDQAGLKESTLGRSSVIWAQSQDQQFGNYGWKDLRWYYYQALTSKDKISRETYFAELSQGIGRQMHLIQDASVPLHTRDDIHVFYTYEGWTEDLVRKEFTTFQGWMGRAIAFDESILELEPNPLARIPIAKIMDTDLYRGTNPDDTASSRIGLAEYSNANFFSEDTTFRDYPYPAWSSVDVEEREVTDPVVPSQKAWRQYYRKMRDGEINREGNEIRGYLLAAAGFLRDFVIEGIPSLAPEYPNYEIPVLDSNVYRDYASFLIPRAVGYSAGLLKYFFRGNLDMERIGGTDTEMEISISNRSNESLINGVFELYYDNDQGDRTKIELSRFYVGSMAPDESYETEFKIPSDFGTGKKGLYMLVYRGKVGEEDGTVIGRYKALEHYACCDVPHTDPSWTGPVAIEFVTLQVGCSNTQVMQATGGCPPYTWAIVAGGGTIEPVDENGFQALYTAPATNPGCTMNPTLVLTDYCGNTDSMQMAVSCDPPGCAAAGVIWNLVSGGCGVDGPDLYLCHYYTEKWTIRCDGEIGHFESYYWVPGDPQIYAGDCNGWYCFSVYVHGGCGNCPPACDFYGRTDLICPWSWYRPACSQPVLHYCGEFEPFASGACIEAGCCGINPFTGVPYSYPEY